MDEYMGLLETWNRGVGKYKQIMKAKQKQIEKIAEQRVRVLTETCKTVVLKIRVDIVMSERTEGW